MSDGLEHTLPYICMHGFGPAVGAGALQFTFHRNGLVFAEPQIERFFCDAGTPTSPFQTQKADVLVDSQMAGRH